jgi:two-component system response regulator AtoC
MWYRQATGWAIVFHQVLLETPFLETALAFANEARSVPSGIGIAEQHRVSRLDLDRSPEVMVVDDDVSMCTFLRAFLEERGYSAITVGNAEEAVRHFQTNRPAAVILDIVMPGRMDGLEALAALKKIDRDIPIIIVSGQGRTATVVQAMKLGASDFVSKPFDNSELELPLANALRQHQLSREVATLREQLQSQSNRTMLFGHSERMAEVRDTIERVADTDLTVLIRGESGTGKELVARALCSSSLRRDKPFVKVNCAALPAELLESELFGFERGSFTGAIQHKPGKFEFANHGTLFLDEIGEMSFPLQAKLLQVLQDGEFSRLGGKHDVHVDVRIVAATNKNLEQAVADGQFREDLFFRLNVVSIMMPPLRERREEVPVLCDYFLKKYSVHYNKPLAELSQDTMRLLLDYDWPGNIRELENAIKRTVVRGSEAGIKNDVMHGFALAAHRAQPPAELRQLPPSSATAPPAVPAAVPPSRADAASALESGRCSLKYVSRIAARGAERDLIARILHQTRWNRKETAGLLGISYKALLYKIKENGLDKAT